MLRYKYCLYIKFNSLCSPLLEYLLSPLQKLISSNTIRSALPGSCLLEAFNKLTYPGRPDLI